MALIPCKECNAEISDQAVACPKCGAELGRGKTRSALKTALIVGVILVAAFFAMDAMFSANKREKAEVEKAFDRLHDATKNIK